MPDAAWKAFERWVAEQMEGMRRGADYGDSRGGKNDIIVKHFSVECKKLKQPAWGSMCDAAQQAIDAKEPGDIAVAVVAKKHSPFNNCLVVMTWEEFLEIVEVVNDYYDQGGE